MFANHQPQISRFARKSPGNFKRVATFVLCTIRMPIVVAAADTPLACEGRACRSIFGAKHDGLAFLRQHGDDLFEELEYLYETGASSDAMLRTMLRMPSMGLAKGGFTLQMIYGLSGCLDTHNLARFGIGPRIFATGSKGTDRRRVSRYNATVADLGGTEHLWNGWCTYVAERGTAGTYDPEIVSALHLAPLH